MDSRRFEGWRRPECDLRINSFRRWTNEGPSIQVGILRFANIPYYLISGPFLIGCHNSNAGKGSIRYYSRDRVNKIDRCTSRWLWERMNRTSAQQQKNNFAIASWSNRNFGVRLAAVPRDARPTARSVHPLYFPAFIYSTIWPMGALTVMVYRLDLGFVSFCTLNSSIQSYYNWISLSWEL